MIMMNDVIRSVRVMLMNETVKIGCFHMDSSDGVATEICIGNTEIEEKIPLVIWNASRTAYKPFEVHEHLVSDLCKLTGCISISELEAYNWDDDDITITRTFQSVPDKKSRTESEIEALLKKSQLYYDFQEQIINCKMYEKVDDVLCVNYTRYTVQKGGEK